jgi:hypothetical protein
MAFYRLGGFCEYFGPSMHPIKAQSGSYWTEVHLVHFHINITDCTFEEMFSDAERNHVQTPEILTPFVQ